MLKITVILLMIFFQLSYLKKECNEDIIVIGAGMSGLSAAHYLSQEGCNVKILEARDRLGGRTYTYDLEVTDGLDTFTVPIDLGASWIHGIGPGIFGLRTHPPGFNERRNPMQVYVEEYELETVQADQFDVDIYSFLGGELLWPDLDIDKLLTKLNKFVYFRSLFAKKGVSVQDIIDKYEYNGYVPEGLTSEQLIDLLYTASFEGDWATSTSDLSAKYLLNILQYKGMEVVFPDGYRQIVDILADGLEIDLEQVVTEIQYPEDKGKNPDAKVVIKTSDDSEYEVDKVVVTVPIGVLQHGDITFDPPLSEKKQEAIESLSLGLLDKLIIYFDNVFWREDADYLVYINEDVPQDYFYAMLNYYKLTGEPMLMIFNSADDARDLSNLSDEDLLNEALEILDTMFGDEVGEVLGYVRTNWSQDPYAYCAYSAIGVEADFKDCSRIQEKIKGRVYFAGEHTYCELEAMTSGAYISGYIAYKDIMKDL